MDIRRPRCILVPTPVAKECAPGMFLQLEKEAERLSNAFSLPILVKTCAPDEICWQIPWDVPHEDVYVIVTSTTASAPWAQPNPNHHVLNVGSADNLGPACWRLLHGQFARPTSIIPHPFPTAA